MISNGTIQEFQRRHGSMVDLNFEFNAKDVPEATANDLLDIIEEFKFRLTAPDTESPKAEKRPAQKKEPLEKQIQPADAEKTPPTPQESPAVPADKKQRGGWEGGKTLKEKYQIPFDSVKEHNQYVAAANLCKKYDKPYAEALKLKEAGVAVPRKPRKERKETPLRKLNKIASEIQKTPKGVEPEDPADGVRPVIVGADSLKEHLPDERPPTGKHEKREAAKAMEGLKVGDKVRQIGGIILFHGVGMVKRLPHDRPGEALVGFDNGTEWIARKNLAVAMG